MNPLHGLAADQCRYIAGEGAKRRCCENKAAAGSSFCAEHDAVCKVRPGTPDYERQLRLFGWLASNPNVGKAKAHSVFFEPRSHDGLLTFVSPNGWRRVTPARSQS